MIGIAGAVRSARIEVLRAAIDALGAGSLSVYPGARPATGGSAPAPLVVFDLGSPCGSVSGPSLEFAPCADATATATGAASWARIRDGAGAFVMDLSAGPVDSDAEVWLDDVNIVAGKTVEFVSGVFTEGNP